MNDLLRRGGTVVAAAALLAAPAAPAAAVRGDDPDVTIEATLSGTGCPKDGTRVVVSKDNRKIDILYSQFGVQAGAVVGDDGSTTWIPNRAKNCNVNLKLTYPQGWAFFLKEASVSGPYDLAGRSTAQHITTFFATGSSETGKFEASPKGPKQDVYDQGEKYTNPPENCGKSFNIGSKVTVTADKSVPDGLSEFALERFSLTLDWRRGCAGATGATR